MNNQLLVKVCISLLMTKDGKTLLKDGIASFLEQWAGNNIVRKIVAKIILLAITPFVKVRKEDATLTAVLNDETWWKTAGDSILHAMVSNDMAVIKESAEAISKYAPSAAEMVCQTIWRYPAKVVTLLSCLPAIVNCGVRFINAALEPINQQSPDLLADVINALMRDIDTKALGCTTNQCVELLHKFDTGDELLKESSLSPFEHTVKGMVLELLNSVTLDTKQRFVTVALSLKNKIHNGLFEALNEKPEDMRMMIDFLIRKKFNDMAHARKYIQGYMAQIRVDELPVEEIAYLVNDVLKTIIMLYDADSTRFISALNRFAHLIDNEVLEDFMANAGGHCFTAFVPVLQRVFPFVLGCWTQLIDNEDEALKQARVNFARALLKDVEVGNV